MSQFNLPSSSLTTLKGFTSRPRQLAPPDDEPKEIVQPTPVKASQDSLVNAANLEAAIAVNRANTPQEKVLQRAAPRYSIREVNSLTPEQIRERLTKINPSDDRPGWVKVLDIIDMPRNFTQNIIADEFVPEAKRMAMERGEFDQAGQVKVYGSDILRAMGVENRAISAIGGFAVDVFTDPLSFIGGPIGGLKNVGTRGTVELSVKGRRVINSAINSVRNGGAVSDTAASNVIRNMLDDAAARGVKIGDTLVSEANEVQKADYLHAALIGGGSKISDTAEKFGLGRFTKGGYISDDVYKVVDKLSPTEAARVKSIKEFVSKYSNNGVLDFTKGKGGAEVLHVPFFPSTTVTVPSFKLPGTRMRFGHQAAMQKAATKVLNGNAVEAQSILNAVGHVENVYRISSELESLSSEIMAAERSGTAVPGILVDRKAELIEELGDAIEGGKAFREAHPVNIQDTFNAITDPGTLFATMDLYETASVQARHSEKLVKFKDVLGESIRTTRSDIASAKKHYELMAEEAKSTLGVDYDDFYDSLLHPSKRVSGMNAIIEGGMNRASYRWRELIDINSDDLETIGKIADGFSEHMEAANSVANLYQTTIRHAMSSEANELADAAKMMLRLSDKDTGHLPLGSIANAFGAMGFSGLESRMRNFGEKIAVNLGGVKGNMPDMMRHIRGQYSTSRQVASERFHHYRNGIESAMRKSDLARAEDYNVLAELAGVRLEQKMIQRATAELPHQTNMFDNAYSAGQTKINEAISNGLFRDKELMSTIDELAEQAADELQLIAKEAIARGDFDNPLVMYSPVMLKDEAARRAALARSRNPASSASQLGEAGVNSIDPTKQRITNMVEFVDKNGKQHRFTIAEGNAYADVKSGVLASLEGAEARNAAAVNESVQAFRETFGTNAKGDALAEIFHNRSRPMTNTELNDYASTGRLDPIVGGAISSGEGRREFFETDMAKIVYNRLAAHEVLRAKESLRDIVDEYAMIRMPVNDYNKTVAGEEAIMSNGVRARNLGDGRLRIGNTTYVHIKRISDKFGDDTIFDPVRVLGADSAESNAFIPETLATEMMRVADTLRPEKMNEIMQAAERVTSMFRTTTLLHPSWIVTNAVGNTVLAAMGGALSDPKRAAKYMKFMSQSLRAIMRKNADEASQLKFVGRGVKWGGNKFGTDLNTSTMIGGGPQRIGSILEQADTMGVTSAGRSADVADSFLKQMGRDLPGMSDDIAEAGLKGSFKREVDRRRVGRKSKRLASAADYPAAALQTAPTYLYKKGIGTWFSVNGTVDDVFRNAYFMLMLDDGNDAITAASKTRNAMLNFGDMSSFEKNTIRPLIPFYAWMRASLPSFMMKGIKDPKLLSSVPKVQQGLEEALAGEERLPRHMRPRWLQETMAIQMGTDPETRKAILAGTLLPQEGAFQVATAAGGLAAAAIDPDGSFLGFDGNDFMDGVNWLFSQGSPAGKVPIELAQGKEIFSGREIGVRPGEGDVTLQEYLMNQVRPIKEFGLGVRRGEAQKAFDKGVASGVARVGIGGRVQDGLQEDKRLTNLWFDLKDRDNTLRKSIRVAEKNGDDERVVKLKIQLLGEYKKFIDRGGSRDDIPKWARDDLERFSP